MGTDACAHRRIVPRTALACAVLALAIAGCATRGGGGRDGPEARPPADLDKVPDAVPKIEPIRIGGPNKPYEIDGRTYVPITDDRSLVEKGLASWYGKKFHGRRTSSGEAYNMYAMTAAHPTLPIPSYARVRNPANGREVIVRVNDRGPFSPGRIIDLSYTAALKLGVLGGVAPVEVERITAEAIRSGAAFRNGTKDMAKDDAPASTIAKAAVPSRPAPTTGVAPGLGLAAAAVIGGPGTAVIAPLPAAPAATTATTATTATSSSPPSNADATASPVPLAVSAAASSPGPGPTPPSPPAAEAPSAPAPLAGPSAKPAGEETGRAFTPGAVGFWVQLGAYKLREGALSFQRQISDQEPWLAPLLAVYSDKGLHKLQAGPYATREDARNAAEKIRLALQLVPTVVEKR